MSNQPGSISASGANDGATPAPDGPQLHQIASRVLGQPLMIHPSMGEVVSVVLGGRIGVENQSLSPEANRFIGSYQRKRRSRGMSRAQDGVAIITIAGSLVNRGAWIGASSGLVSYEGIEAQLADAVADPEVHAVVFDIDTPGGEALGVFGLAAAIRACPKPTVAWVNDMAASAGYAIASSCDEVVVTSSSVVGSIGVVMMRLDAREKAKKDGVAVTVFHAGAYKADGNPFTGMDEAEQKRTQSTIDRFYSLFVTSVAAGRGARLSEKQARATEAGIYVGEEAVQAGLADRVGSLASILQELKPKAAKRLALAKTAKAVSLPKAPAQKAHSAGPAVARTHAEAVVEGAAAERERISAILNGDEAQGRKAQARILALETDLSPEAAAKVLKATPIEKPKIALPTIAMRSAELADFGPSPKDPWVSERASADETWGRAVAKVNGTGRP